MALKARGRITSKGQVTIPKAIREALAIEAGRPLDFELVDGGFLVKPAARFTDLYGSVPPRNRPEDLEALRKDAWEFAARRALERGKLYRRQGPTPGRAPRA